MSRHTVCAWTFNTGEAGFRPAIRRQWAGIKTKDVVGIIGREIKPRLPKGIELGLEVHYDNEINERTAPGIAEALCKHGMYLGMITPGLHKRFAYGGPASLDPEERKAANDMCMRTVDLAYSDDLKRLWHPEAPPTIVLWNGSWGYEITGPWILEMLGLLDESIGELISYEQKVKGGGCFWAVEPKRDEGHPKMLVPHAASGLKLVDRVLRKYPEIDSSKVGDNMELGHEEILNLDTAHSIAEQMMEAGDPGFAKCLKECLKQSAARKRRIAPPAGRVVHLHANSQGRDGINEGGPGQYDVDYGVAITWPNISIARMLKDAGYRRWIGHDFQPRAHDREEYAIQRVTRSILGWEAMDKTVGELPLDDMRRYLERRDTATVRDLAEDAVERARSYATTLYKQAGVLRGDPF